MKQWITRMARFLREEDGPTAVEYAFMLVLIVVVCYASIQVVGSTTNNNFNEPVLKAALTGS